MPDFDFQQTLDRLQVLNEACESDLPMVDIAEMIARDTVLAERVLRAANGATRGSSRQVTNLEDAVVLLGTSALESLIIDYIDELDGPGAPRAA